MLSVAKKRATGVLGVRPYSTREYKIGQKFAGFTVGDVHKMPKLGVTAVQLRHHDTGAKHLHVDRDDTNNVFSIGFKTNPPDCTGVPHILEHTTLCGSQKYPVKDPFFAMLTRSLANFMNAMTGLDYTFYPFATTNQKDFKNLQKVYLDAVYNPLLREADFKQEGWRLERETSDPDSKVIYKGVVYNEMKGMVSDPSYHFNEQFLRNIYPSLNSSGGDPAFIPDLKYDQLKHFHQTRYHPSNSFTYSYGQMDLEEILEPIRDTIKGVKKLKKPGDNKTILQPIQLKEDKTVETFGPMDPLFDETRQYKASVSWIVSNTSDMDQVVLWRVLNLLLTYGHSSPFYKALIDSGLGSDFSANTGLQDLPGKAIFSIGLQGLKESDVETFKDKVQQVLANVAKDGVPKEHLDAIINLVELSQREVEANYGLGLVSKLMPRVFNGDSSFDIIDEEAMLNRFKKLIKDSPKEFQKRAQTLLESGKFEFVMKPDANFEQQLKNDEEARLARDVAAAAAAAAAEGAKDDGQVVEAEKEDESIMPMLETDEIAPEKPKVEVQQYNDMYVRETGTQGLTYITLLKNLGNVPARLRPLLPLFSSAMTNMGTFKHDMSELENKIRLTTGGVDAGLHVTTDPYDMANYQAYLTVGGSSLDEKSFYLYDFFNQFLTQVNYSNVEKLRQLIQSSAANAMGELSQSGNAYAVRHSAAAITAKRRLDNTLNGVEQVQFMKRLAEMDDEQLLKQVVPGLQEIAAIVGTTEGMKGGVTFTPGNDNLKHNQALFEDLVCGLPSGGEVGAITDVTSVDASRTVYELPFGVSFIGMSVQGVPYTHPDSAPLRVLSSLLTYKYLHQEIREKGGAYGGGASYSPLDGVLSFFSYRDPNPANSYNTIVNSLRWVLARDIGRDELVSAKLSIFQGLDAPVSPRNEISLQFLSGIDDHMRNNVRADLLKVSPHDVRRVAETYLAPLAAGASSATVLGPQGCLDATLVDVNKWHNVQL